MSEGGDPIMKQIVSICVAWGVAVWAVAAEGVRETPVPRQPGGRLHLSIQNEADAAVSRARWWLQTVQHPDGHWGESNRLTTAYAVLALHPMPEDDTLQAAIHRGQEWLRNTSDSGTNTFWTALASGADAPTPPAGAVDATKPLALDIDSFAPLSGSQVVLIAEINRTIHDGLAVTPTDWRERLAGKLIAGQHVDPQTPGAGFWSATGQASKADAAAQTALAILILMQL